MPCVPLPAVPLPTLPDPLTLEPELPDVAFDPSLCCKIVAFPPFTPPFQLPSGTLAALAPLNAALAQIQAYLDALPLSCPKE